MPYGYEKYRLNNNISHNTVVHEVRLIRSFLAFVNGKYKKSIAPHEIRPIDVKDFLDAERAAGIQDTTVNRKLVFLRNWFDYMWKIGKIPLDFMPKLEYSKSLNLKSVAHIPYRYTDLLDAKDALFSNSRIQLHAKLLFLFFMRGLRIRDIVQIKIEDFTDNGHSIELDMRRIGDTNLLLTFKDPLDIGILLMGIERAVFTNSPYILYSKIQEEYLPLRMGSLKDYHQALKDFFGFPIRSEELRYSYVHYLYRVQEARIEDIQQIMGLKLINTTRLLKEALERVEKVPYNVETDQNKAIAE